MNYREYKRIKNNSKPPKLWKSVMGIMVVTAAFTINAITTTAAETAGNDTQITCSNADVGIGNKKSAEELLGAIRGLIRDKKMPPLGTSDDIRIYVIGGLKDNVKSNPVRFFDGKVDDNQYLSHVRNITNNVASIFQGRGYSIKTPLIVGIKHDFEMDDPNQCGNNLIPGSIHLGMNRQPHLSLIPKDVSTLKGMTYNLELFQYALIDTYKTAEHLNEGNFLNSDGSLNR